MEKSGSFEYHVVGYDEFMADPYRDYNEDCDPGFQGRVIIDDDYISDIVYFEEMVLSVNYYYCR